MCTVRVISAEHAGTRAHLRSDAQPAPADESGTYNDCFRQHVFCTLVWCVAGLREFEAEPQHASAANLPWAGPLNARTALTAGFALTVLQHAA